MGVVYRARDPIINRMVALKTITTGVADDPALLERFYREAQSAGGLQHPNIVTIYDMGEAGNLPYIAMELVEGENLEQVIARRAVLPITLKLVYVMQACRAFDYAHKRGIVHRDIKPGNVMLGKDGTVKVVDFGIARVMETSRTQTGMLIGTFAYMSPEQYHGEHADERSDIWSFGVLLYELLSYQRPFTGPTPASLMLNICQENPAPLTKHLAETPPELEVIITRVLQKSPGERYQSMEDLLLELEPICKKLQVQYVADLVETGREAIERGEFAQSKDLLRQALQVDSGNQQARSLLDKANIELKRLQNRPNAEHFIEKGRALLDEGRLEEAKGAVESALHLDSTFGAAQELQHAVESAIEQARSRAKSLEAAKQYLAEGLPEDAEVLLVKVLEAEPSNKEALALQQQVAGEKAERQRRAQLRESLRQARELWTQQNYAECIHLLVDLEAAFPGEDEVNRLLESARDDQIEQQKQQGLLESRNLLAAGRHDECLALLTSLQKQFPQDAEIPRLLEDIRKDQMDRRRLQKLAEARNLIGGGQYDDSISLLSSLRSDFPEDREIPKLLETAQQNKNEQRRQQSIAEARKHLAARRYEKCLSLLAALEKEFPRDDEILKLQDAVREEQAEERKNKGLGEARNLLASRHYEDCLSLLTGLEKQFPGDEEVRKLQQTALEEQAENRKLQRLQEVRNLLRSKDHDKALALLAVLQKEFPEEDEVLKLQASARKEQEEQKRREGLAQARKFLAAGQYEQSIALLGRLQTEFSADNEIGKLLQLTRQEQAQHRVQQGLTEARTLLAARRYDESIAILQELQAEFPAETEIRKQLATAREDLAEQDKQKKLSEARSRLAAQSFDEALALLNSLAETHPKDASVLKLRTLVEREQEKHARTERLQSELDALKKLMAEKKYSEVLARTKPLLADFPGEPNFARLAEFATSQQAAIEKEQLFRKTVEEAKTLFAANRFEEALRSANKGLQNFPGNLELLNLAGKAETQQRKLEVRQQIEMRIKEIRVKINREKFSEAIDLAEQTLVTLGPDTDLNQLLNSAQVEIAAREKKREQEKTIETIRTLVESGRLDAASQAVDDALKTHALETFDPRIQRLSEQIKDAKTQTDQKSSPASTPAPSASVSREYAFLEPPPMPGPPVPAEQAAALETPVHPAVSRPAPASQPEELPAPVPPMEPVARVAPVESVVPPAPVAPVMPAMPVPPSEAVPQRQVRVPEPEARVQPPPAPRVEPAPPAIVAPVVPVVRVEIPAVPLRPNVPAPAEPTPPAPVDAPAWRKPFSMAAIAVVLIGAVWAGVVHLRQPKPSPVIAPTAAVKPSAPPPVQIDPLEAQQRDALTAANKLIAANDLAEARKTLQQAATLKGPLTSDIQRKLAEIDESLKDAGLRQLRQSEEKLWQQATSHMASSRFPEAQRDLRQILALPAGGVHRDEAQNYLDKVLPQRVQQNTLLTQARQALKQGDFSSARQAATRVQQSGGDAGSLVAEINQTESARLEQLEAQFNLLKQRDDDAGVQQLKALQLRLQALGGDGGPQSSEALNYANNIPAAIADAQARMQKKTADAAFQRTIQKYQQAIGDNDKNALAAARSDLQAVVQGGGPHADEALKYRTDLDNKLAALSQPSAPPPQPAPAKIETPAPAAVRADNSDGDVRAVIQAYAQAYNQRNADALRQVRPSLSSKDYGVLKKSFEAATSIHVQINVQSVEFSVDGSSAVVKSNMSLDYTQKTNNVKRSDPTVFRLAKSNGVWLITDVK
jgi:eukaryotic-like serine/threonine-protein kinase